MPTGGPYTYTTGFTVCAGSVTFRDIAEMCGRLESRYISELDQCQKFRPERISEGGIVFKNLEKGQYKSFRL